MTHFIEQIIATLWNRAHTRPPGPTGKGFVLGWKIVDGRKTDQLLVIPESKRAEHAGIVGITGTGKSTLQLRSIQADLAVDRGLICFVNHRPAIVSVFRVFAHEERRRNTDLSDRLIFVDPTDPDWSVGINITATADFVQIAELVKVLRERWRLDGFGARTEELLRNSLYLLADNNFTLLELSPLLTNAAFRQVCLRSVTNAEVKAYFLSRYDRASEGMQAVLRDPILNKVTAFTADPRFRHLLGQRRSTFSIIDSISKRRWIVFALDKGQLGDQASIFGSLFLTKTTNELFGLEGNVPGTINIDEVQNYIASKDALETLLAEARKFAISVVTANQFLDQFPGSTKAAMLAAGSHVFFRLSSLDADRVANALDGGRNLAEVLKNLPQRHFIAKIGHHRWQRGVVPDYIEPTDDYEDLYNRCRARWARRRTDIEAEIQARLTRSNQGSKEVLDAWE